MLSREQQREILAVGLLALAVFTLVALVPISIFGERGVSWFPSGNTMGVVGGALKSWLLSFLGGSAFLAPLLLVIAGLRSGDWMARDRSIRFAVLDAGLLLLVPPLVWVITARPEAAGWLGASLGGPLLDLVGWLGAILICSTALVALSVGTLGWNPLRTVAHGVAAGGGLAGRSAQVLVTKGKALAEAHAEAARLAAAEAAAAAAQEEPEEETPLVEELEPESFPEPEPEVLPPPPVGKPRPARARKGSESAGVEAAVAGLAASATVAHATGGVMPPMDILAPPEERDRAGQERQLDELGRILVEKLKTFNVQCELGGRTTGPVVTQFEIIPAAGVKVNRIANLDADLALAMKAQSVRIVAPIPGKGAVGVEIPNPTAEIVNLREILEAPTFQGAKGELPVALGKDLNGRPYVANLAKMPHVLIAGATGSGKSVCVNTVVTSLVYKHTPETLRFLMIDPKMVELSVYARLPHLRHPVVTDPRDAAGVLKWAVLEMERRYLLLKANHVRSIQEFNRKVKDGAPMRRVEPVGPSEDEASWAYAEGPLPYIVVVVDELADLMMTVQSEVEKPLTQLAQKARAIGIHLIVATQRPSVNVVTGLIKANFPCRIAFRVASKVDSRVMLDANGAESLLGLGDMLILPPGTSDLKRVHGGFVSDEDIRKVVGFIKEQAAPTYQEEILKAGEEDDLLAEELGGEVDEMWDQAVAIVTSERKASISRLQRKLQIGYNRAARIVERMEIAGIVAPAETGKNYREVIAPPPPPH